MLGFRILVADRKASKRLRRFLNHHAVLASFFVDYRVTDEEIDRMKGIYRKVTTRSHNGFKSSDYPSIQTLKSDAAMKTALSELC